jgi:hypothetical protein
MKPLMMILGAAVVAMNVGCAQEKITGTGQDGVVDCTTVVCGPGSSSGGGSVPSAPSAGNGSNTGYEGSTVPLNASVSALRGMFFNSYPNNPTNIQVNFNLDRDIDAVIISYTDGGVVREAGLGTRYPRGPRAPQQYGTRTNAKYNGWVGEGASRVYKAFFQDEYGAIVVVVDKVLNAGDGTPSPYIGGTIYYINHGDNPGYDYSLQGDISGGQKLCWELTYGPYDCRTWVTKTSNYDNAVNLLLSLIPTGPLGGKYQSRTKSYQELGTFVGLNRVASKIPAQ